MTKQQILEQALNLSPDERDQLADELWRSVSRTDQDEIDAAWAEEINRRIESMKRGEGSSKPVDEVVERFRHKHASSRQSQA